MFRRVLWATLSSIVLSNVAIAQDSDSAVGLRTSDFPIFKGTPRPEIEPIPKAPRKFVHPRVFFSSHELPRLRRLLLDKASLGGWELKDVGKNSPVAGAAGLHRLKHILLGTIWTERDQFMTPLFAGPYKPFFDDLLKASKKPGSLDISPEGLKRRYGKNVELHSSNAVENGLGHRGMYGKLSGAAFVSLITQGEEPFNAKVLGRALGATCRHHRPVWRSTDPRKFGFFHDSPMDLGLAYDWLYNNMTEDDISECRSLIATMTGGGRREFGAQYVDFPWTGFNWNWIGWHEHIVALAASIDGEHPTANYSRWVEDGLLVQKRWYQLESSEGGLAREGLGYHTYGLNGALPITVVLARSGENLFETKKTRTALYRMVLYRVYSAAPWIDQYEALDTESLLDSFSHGDNTARGRPRHAIVLRKYFPTDPLIAWAFKTADFSVNFWDPLMSAVFVTDSKPIGNYSNLEAIAKTVSLPENYFCRDRGEMIVRDHWRGDATMFDFEVKMNALSLGHNHADRNSFYLYSRGRAWIVDNKEGDTENIAHQTVLIDGIGQGGGATPKGANTFPGMPGIFLEYSEGVNNGVSWVSGVGDAKPAYDFAANCDPGAVAEGFKCVKSPFSRRDFVYPPDPYLNMPKFEGLTATWMDEDKAQRRLKPGILQFNPVLRAYRTTLFVKSQKASGESHPWALIVDDIQKDQRRRTYEFVMNLPWAEKGGTFWQYRHEYEQVVRDDAATAAVGSSTDMILKDVRDPADSGPRLLIRLLRANGLKPNGFKYIHRRQIRIRKVMKNQIRLARQVVIQTYTVSPEFCVFLYPHELGDELPKTEWLEDKRTLSVKIPDGDQTKWRLSKLSTGRTRVSPMDSSASETSSFTTPAPTVTQTDMVTTTVEEKVTRAAGSTEAQPKTAKQGGSTRTGRPRSTARVLISSSTTGTPTSTAATRTHRGVSTGRSTETKTVSSFTTSTSGQTSTVAPRDSDERPRTDAQSDSTVAKGDPAFSTTAFIADATSTDGTPRSTRLDSPEATTRSSKGDTPAPGQVPRTQAPRTAVTARVSTPTDVLEGLDQLIPHMLVVRSGRLGHSMASGIKLENGTAVCPADYDPKGFSIVCVLPPAARHSVLLYVNEKLWRKERFAPYSYGGDSGPGIGNIVRPWLRYPRTPRRPIVLRCASSDGYGVTVNMRIACSEPSAYYEA